MVVNKQKVFVGMSGGVDSSVSAALLKKEGYDVTGVFMNVWQPDFIECSKGDDRREAMRAATHLDIPFLVFDFEKEYKEAVVDYMIAEYKAGRTPNPDVMCNKHVKFKAFFNKALEMGADFIATGHYVHIRQEIPNPKSQIPKYHLLAGVDKNKDQSYFLWTLGQRELSKTLFPVGNMEKPDVRKLAEEFGLPNALRPDSQGVCFIGEFAIKDFLKHFIKEKRGNVLNEKGEIIGHHDGVFFLTLGQRHGFTVTKKTPDTPKLYVIGKDVSKNTITVGPRAVQEETGITKISVKDASFILGVAPTKGEKLFARFRYRQSLLECIITEIDSREFSVEFNELQKAVAPGQSLVLYRGEECLGGGVIA